MPRGGMSNAGGAVSEQQLAALSKELGGKTLPDLQALSGAEIASITESLRRARHNQEQQLQRAFDAALGHIPLLLRGPVRKILLP